MAVKIASVTFDCADALRVARFWSAALGRPPRRPAKPMLAKCGDAWGSSLGGTRIADRQEYGYTWTVMADPEGNEFCVAKAR